MTRISVPTEKGKMMREKLIGLIKQIVIPYFAEMIADILLANGVTIPVRCKECEFFKDTWTSDDGKVYGYCPHMAIEHSENGYCMYGERRTDD